MRLDIVNAEASLFSGEVAQLVVNGAMGELGIAPGHAQLLTTLRRGLVRATLPDKTEVTFDLAGGILEVQPYLVSILADI